MRKYLTQEDILFIQQAGILATDTRLYGNAGGLHGYDHIARVACMAEVIRQKSQDTGLDSKTVLLAGLLHDHGRTNGSGDPRHGIRGAIPAASSLVRMALEGVVQRDYDKMGAIVHTVIHHCDSGPSADMLTMIVKDADKLDRMRTGVKALDVGKLELTVSIGLVEEAKVFTQREWEFKDGLS